MSVGTIAVAAMTAVEIVVQGHASSHPPMRGMAEMASAPTGAGLNLRPDDIEIAVSVDAKFVAD